MFLWGWVLAWIGIGFVAVSLAKADHTGIRAAVMDATLCTDPEYMEVSLYQAEKGMDLMESFAQTNKLAKQEVCFDLSADIEVGQRMGRNTFTIGGRQWHVYEIYIHALIVGKNGQRMPPPHNAPPLYGAMVAREGGA